MVFSLNKKFFFSILTFFIITASMFLILLDGTLGKKIRSEHSNAITRNQYVIELLNENISLRKKIKILEPNATINLDAKQDELSREKKLNEELIQNYNEDYAALYESLKVIGFGAILTFFSLIAFWFLLRIWITNPVENLTLLSTAIANGDFSKRITPKKRKFTDEFDTLNHTINFMLENINNNINEIKEKESFLQNLLNALPDAIRVIDENYNIILSNKSYLEHIKKDYFCDSIKCYQSYKEDASCPCSSTEYICPLHELKKKKSATLKLIHSVNDKPLSINSAKININNKYGIVESIRDLSENVTYSHQQKISSLGFLATSLAHEMKNNLGAINLIIDGIIQKYHNTQETEEKRYLEMISSQIKECIKVPERLLKISRNSEQQSTDFNVTSSIADILSLLDYEIKSKGINLVKNFSNNKENITGNETDFKMIILNITQNAINAMPQGGTLEIKTNNQRDNLLIEIKDTGIGISENDIKHIFEPFYSVTTDSKTKGTGLGLAIVKDLLLKLNAQISVNSKKNEGSSFKITIPRQKTQKRLVK